MFVRFFGFADTAAETGMRREILHLLVRRGGELTLPEVLHELFGDLPLDTVEYRCVSDALEWLDGRGYARRVSGGGAYPAWKVSELGREMVRHEKTLDDPSSVGLLPFGFGGVMAFNFGRLG